VKRLSTPVLLAAVLVMCAAGRGWPQSSSLSADATVVASAQLSVSAMRFGRIGAPGLYEAAALITVRAAKGVGYSITLDAGQNGGPQGRRLRLQGGQDTFSYELWKDPARTLVWGDGDFAGTYPGGSSLPAVGTGRHQEFTVYGRLYAMEEMSAPGRYGDVVTVTIHY
jgi:spore coat protein U-like protein